MVSVQSLLEFLLRLPSVIGCSPELEGKETLSSPGVFLSGVYDSNLKQAEISPIVCLNSYSISIRLLPDLLHNCSIFILPGVCSEALLIIRPAQP